MYYTLTTAAKATGLDASEILRAIESGQITGSRGEFGEWRVEIAELHRVYPAVAEPSANGDIMGQCADSTAATPEAEIEALIRRAGDRLQQQLEEMLSQRRAECDHAQASLQEVAKVSERLPPQPLKRSA